MNPLATEVGPVYADGYFHGKRSAKQAIRILETVMRALKAWDALDPRDWGMWHGGWDWHKAIWDALDQALEDYAKWEGGDS